MTSRAIASLLVSCALAALAGCRSGPRAEPGPYNVLLVSLDTVRQDLLGCYGRRPRRAPALSTSPALDRLARAGVRMVDAYASSAWTLPSHLSLMTGVPPLQHGVETEGATLDPAIPTLAEILRARGYRTIGVYSAPYLDPHWGFARGFDAYRATYGADVEAVSRRAADTRAEIDAVAAAGDWPRYDDLKRRQVAIDAELNDRSQLAVTSDEVATTVVTELETLARERRPWFVFAHFFDAHCDYAPPPPFDRRFDPDYAGTFTARGCMSGPAVGRLDPERPGGLIRALSDRDLEHAVALYEGELAWVDGHVERILKALDDLGLGERTLVVITADHGEEFFEHDGLGHRRTLNEEVTRVPLLLRLPGVLPAGAAVRGLVSGADVFATILDVLGMTPEPSPGVASFLPLLQGGGAGAERTVMDRTVIMFGGEVQVDASARVTLRQIVVHDAFWQGAIKIVRTRSWPQFQSGLASSLGAVLEREAAAQYDREQLRWIDLGRFPGEPDERYSTAFDEPAARAALEAFRGQYGELLALRAKRQPSSPLPRNVRAKLESLGYLERETGPAFPEPDLVLPPPRAG